MKLTTLSLAAGFLALSFATSNAMPLCGVGQICQVPKGVGQLQPAKPNFNINPAALKPIKMPPVNIPVTPLPGGPLPVPPKPVDQGPSFGINVNLGGNGYGNSYDGPDYGDYISCGEAKQIVRHHGFKKVKTQECSGDEYTFFAKRKGQAWIVQVSDSGEITNVDHLY